MCHAALSGFLLALQPCHTLHIANIQLASSKHQVRQAGSLVNLLLWLVQPRLGCIHTCASIAKKVAHDRPEKASFWWVLHQKGFSYALALDFDFLFQPIHVRLFLQ